MNLIVIRAQRFGLVMRTYPIVLSGAMLGGVLAHGLFPLTNLFQYIVEGLIAGALLVFFPLKNLTIVLDETSLRAPLARSLCFKSTTVDLSEIVISRSMIARLHGSQVSTHDGQKIRISSLFYGRKGKLRLIREIESRKEKLGSGQKVGGDTQEVS